MSLLLGVDVGTTATKAVLLDPDTGPVASGERPVQLRSPNLGYAEESPEEWWRNVVALCRELCSGREVAGVGVTGMVPCVIPLDAQGSPLRPSIQQNDARAVKEIDELRRRLAGARVLERTGSALTQQSVGPKLLWLAKNEPETWARTALIIGSYEFVASRLVGEAFVEANWALESGLFDLETGDWGADLLQACGATRGLLPPVRRPHEVVGEVTPAAASSTGLAPGTPVVAGSADHVASAFAAGIVQEGDLLVKLGGAGDILMATERPLVDERLYLDFHLVPDRYLPNGCMAASGSVVRWFQAELAGGTPLAELDREADAAGPGAHGIVALPYFLGEKTPINDPLARGAFVGLHLGARRGDLFRAVLESVAFGVRHHLEVFAERGHVPRRVRVTDGGSRSDTWTRIAAGVLGLPLERLSHHGGSALGAAFVAGMGVGAFSDWDQIERFIHIQDVVEPGDRTAYERSYAIYRALYPALKAIGT
jgi:xylulokinase